MIDGQINNPFYVPYVKDVQCIEVDKLEGQRVVGIIKDNGLLDSTHKIRVEGVNLLIPVTDGHQAISLLKGYNVHANIVFAEMERKVSKPQSIYDYLVQSLPQNLWNDIPTAFDIIGDIAIVDLKESLVDYETEVGMAIMLVHPSIRSVYRKIGGVSGQYRLRPLKLIAGMDEPLTFHKEYGLDIMVDVRNTYFSPRLSTEHHRVASNVREGEQVLDLFCGVGSFPLHIASLVECEVVAVDINPSAISCLKKSIEKNRKRLKGRIIPVLTDASQFFPDKKFDRIIMNHPSGSRDFFGIATNLLAKGGIVHYYTFAPIKDYENAVKEELNLYLQDFEIMGYTKIRQYSPTEYHLAVDLKRKY